MHHINFLVRDLDAAVRRYREAFGVPQLIEADLGQRGVRTARFDLGGVWIVLVQPVDDSGIPARHLREHGEGLFLVSLAVGDLEKACLRVTGAGARMRDAAAREGLEDWRVMDLDPRDFFGAQLQFTESG